MTKEEAAYAAALNRVGSDVEDGLLFSGVLGRLRREALHSTGPHADCPHCWWSVRCDGAVDGDHFLALWEHLIVRHGVDVWLATAPAREAWETAVAEYEGAKAA